ncbi:P-loop containing nucleoside triphosphate hydrolase protein [Choiromyces venosus 120613-1]|uniref:RNA helicase n=1 Tax=Choiromyces venosus 120613-1 TaxID=1336337 RepID=A0A3N4K9J1_9PEZI|nr:P-loop containing nucleoside triphosphate hydrolase protein [Choiromyces venosus 120613-1]
MASADRATESEECLVSLYRPSTILPITRHRDALLSLVESYPVTIVVGQTGSGKTTQLPQYLHQAGWTEEGKIIACTQPRRVAATTVATRVAEEMGVRLGEEVGYSIRFEDMTSPRTRIKYMTDGMLLREALVDPLLSRYSVVMIDEAHERSLSTDVLLGILKKIRRRRKDLRIVVSSATLQAEEFARFFEDGEESGEKKKGADKDDGDGGEEKKELAKIISLEGRCYPVDVLYLEEPTENYMEKAVQTVFDIHLKARSINIHFLGSSPTSPANFTAPQLAVFDPAPENYRKVIVSTNIAEASVTIENIVFVIDCGFVKLRAFDPRTGIETLTAVPVSKASATQRAGRAGRTRAGKCFRLYTQRAFNDVMAEMGIPEIQRSNLAPVLLQLKALGIDNVVRFDFITPPPSELMVRALELLFSLGALDDYARLTKPLGLRMAEMPVDPMTAKILLNSVTFQCTDQILSIAAMTSVQNVFITHEGSKKPAESAKPFAPKANKPNAVKWCKDHYLNFRALSRAVSGIRRCLTTGYFSHAARMQPDGSFRSVNGMQLWAHPSSVMFNRKADWVVFHEVVETGQKTFIRDVTAIEKDWLLEYAPGFYQLRK